MVVVVLPVLLSSCNLVIPARPNLSRHKNRFNDKRKLAIQRNASPIAAPIFIPIPSIRHRDFLPSYSYRFFMQVEQWAGVNAESVRAVQQSPYRHPGLSKKFDCFLEPIDNGARSATYV